MIPVWDIWVRIFHGSLVIAVGYLLLSGETGFAFLDWHKPIGEFVAALILFRILWGVFGSTNARLHTLIKSPASALSHLKNVAKKHPHQERGHNAAGGLAVLLMLLVLAVQSITGMFIADEDEFVEGRFYGLISSDNSDLLYSVHHFNGHLIQLLVFVHIVMVLIYLLWAKQNLIKPMITGSMKWPGNSEPESIKLGSVWLGLLLAILTASAFIWVFYLSA